MNYRDNRHGMPDNKQNNLGAIMRPKGKAQQPAYNAGLMNGEAASDRAQANVNSLPL